MIADADQHRAEDTQLREIVNARNELDSAAYQVERRLNELGDAVALHDKARAETLVADARTAIKEEQGIERLRSLTADLQQMYQALASAQASAASGPAGPTETGTGRSAADDDDVIDAEFTPS
jgi:molecular chaperone DnaK